MSVEICMDKKLVLAGIIFTVLILGVASYIFPIQRQNIPSQNIPSSALQKQRDKIIVISSHCGITAAQVYKKIFVENGVPSENIKLLSPAVKDKWNEVAGCFNSHNWLYENSDENNDVLFLIMGHGASSGFCTVPEKGASCRHNCYGVQYKNINRHLIRSSQFNPSVLKYRSLFFSISTCHSGGAIPRINAPDTYILTSTDAEHESGGFNSVFFWALKGMADHFGNCDGWVSTDEVYSCMRMLYNPEQTEYNPQREVKKNVMLTYVGEPDGSTDQVSIKRAQAGHGFPIKQSFKSRYNCLTRIMVPVSSTERGTYSVELSITQKLYGNPVEKVRKNVELNGFENLLVFDIDDLKVFPGDTLYFKVKGLPFPNFPHPAEGYHRGAGYVLSDDEWTKLSKVTSGDTTDIMFYTLGKNADGTTPPVARFEYNIDKSNGKIYLESTSQDPDGYIRKYTWKESGGEFSDKRITQLDVPEKGGRLDISLTVEDSSGAMDTTQKMITVTPEEEEEPLEILIPYLVLIIAGIASIAVGYYAGKK